MEMTTRQFLQDLFLISYSLRSLKRVEVEPFKTALRTKIGSLDAAIEGYLDEAGQRDLSRKFHWGHDHDFGDGFVLHGRMRDRHIKILSDFVDQFGLETNLQGKRVLDIGVWTGGTSLLLAAMGAEVISLEEVVKYAECVNYLAFAFGVESKLRCFPLSLFDFLPRFSDFFDLAIYPGVVYHVTDPLLSLRLIYSALKDGGKMFIETLGADSTESSCRYDGPSLTHSGDVGEANRGGWNYFIPSKTCLEIWCRDVGFQKVEIGPCTGSRIEGVAIRATFQDFCRAGLSKTSCR
jgi:SAM-dependent methyltransferase